MRSSSTLDQAQRRHLDAAQAGGSAEAVRRQPGGDDHRQPVLGRDQAQLVGGQQFGFVDVIQDQQAAAVFAHLQLIFRRMAILEVAQLLVDRVTPGMGDSLELRQCALGLFIGRFFPVLFQAEAVLSEFFLLFKLAQRIAQVAEAGAFELPDPAGGVEIGIGDRVLARQRRFAQAAGAVHGGQQAGLVDRQRFMQLAQLFVAADEVPIRTAPHCR